MGKNLFTMSLISGLTIFLLLTVVSLCLGEQPELKLVNVVFRHGDRTPDTAETYLKDPYRNMTFYPVGHGGLTNEGKRREFNLGQALRALYGDFLGSVYIPSSIEARSTYYDRTKMSLQLVLSGLYPPAPIQQWNRELNWQPIPTNYKRSFEDILLLPDECPKYKSEYARVRDSPEVVEKFSRFDRLAKHLEKHTGRVITSAYDLYDFYHIFTAQRAANLTLPEWVYDIYPDGDLLDGAVLQYRIYSYNQKLKKLNGGPLVRKMSEDAVAMRSGTLPAGRKMYLYSCHETNIGSLLNTLGVYDSHVPQYSSAVVLELWELRNEYFVKVLYYRGIPATFTPKIIPGCAELCPLDEFLEIMGPVMPSDSDLICVKKDTGASQTSGTSSL